MNQQREYELAQAVARIEAVVETTHARLFGGDGVEGEIPKIKADVQSLKDDRSSAKGALKVIGWITGLLGGTEILHIFKKGF